MRHIFLYHNFEFKCQRHLYISKMHQTVHLYDVSSPISPRSVSLRFGPCVFKVTQAYMVWCNLCLRTMCE